jgi:hypothetical protein
MAKRRAGGAARLGFHRFFTFIPLTACHYGFVGGFPFSAPRADVPKVVQTL